MEQLDQLLRAHLEKSTLVIYREQKNPSPAAQTQQSHSIDKMKIRKAVTEIIFTSEFGKAVQANTTKMINNDSTLEQVYELFKCCTYTLNQSGLNQEFQFTVQQFFNWSSWHH